MEKNPRKVIPTPKINAIISSISISPAELSLLSASNLMSI
jgi:hypothetical protein